ncbi:hypothetical protein FoTM2_014687 [Fusarium oxysporum f. sp. vasinfectum]|nr:hypothetical protein FoTM2_014687 [Fusarium oxysporum f. sp. vasinfectum]
MAVDMVIDRCEQTARTTSRSLLCWLRSVHPHGCYAKPFTFVGKAASRRKYIRLLKRFVALVFRAYRLPADIRQRRAGICFKKSQLRLISALWNHEAWAQHDALNEQLWRSMKLSDGADIEIDRDVESTDGEEDYEDEDEDDSDDESSVRLLFLEYALLAQGYPRLGIARRPRTGQIARLQNVRKEYLVLGSQSPFEELFSLLVFGRAIAGSETPAFLLKWSDNGQILSYRDDIAVHMEQFRRLPKALLAHAESLCEQLMYGWKPLCDLSSVKDDMANTTHRFSFVNHPKNGLAEAYLELSLKACTS